MFLLRSYFNVLCRRYLDILDLYFMLYISVWLLSCKGDCDLKQTAW